MDFFEDSFQKENGFLPVSPEELREQGIEQLDFVYVIGDAYVDHPSFGYAIISRVLQAHGYTVGIISQPDWKRDDSISVLGRPRLGFLVSAGNMDSCVNHYSVSKKRRPTDAYTPGGETGKRPDHAAAVYGNLIRRTYKDVPVIAPCCWTARRISFPMEWGRSPLWRSRTPWRAGLQCRILPLYPERFTAQKTFPGSMMQ